MLFAHMPQLVLVQHKQTNSKHPWGQWEVYLGNAVCKMAITLKSASGVCSQHSFCAKTRGILLSSFLQAIVSIAIGHGSGWVSYSFAPDSKHFLCLPSSLPLLHSMHCKCHVTKCQHWCHSGLRKSPGACCNANHSGDAWSPLCWVKCLKEKGKGKSTVSSAFHLCLGDKMGEELSSIWTVLIVDGLSAVLQAKRFSSGVGEEQHICHNSLGLLCAGRGFWIETLGWWGMSGGCYLSWHPDIPVKTTDKKKKNHST